MGENLLFFLGHLFHDLGLDCLPVDKILNVSLNCLGRVPLEFVAVADHLHIDACINWGVLRRGLS